MKEVIFEKVTIHRESVNLCSQPITEHFVVFVNQSGEECGRELLTEAQWENGKALHFEKFGEECYETIKKMALARGYSMELF